MGVKHLSSWFMGKLHREAIKRIDTLGPVHTLAIDLNDTLHRAMNRAKHCEHRFYGQVLVLLKQAIKATQPQDNIGIFMDGVAPAAKLLLQIKRRRSSPPDSMFTAPLFSSLAITPGTPAMRNLANRIKESLCVLREHHIHFSCSDEPGEGEIKIVKWLRTIPRHLVGNVLIFGADADFLPISCMQHRLHSARICLDMPNYGTVPVSALRRYMDNGMDTAKGQMEDFAVLMMMLGNDYLPKLAGGFSPDLAMNAYKQTGFPRLVHVDTQTGIVSLDRDGLIRVFEYLESVLHPIPKRGVDFNGQESDQSQGECICSVADIKAFFDGIAWLASMYHSGECPDYRFRIPARVSTISVSMCLEWLRSSDSERIFSPMSDESPLDVELAQLIMTPLWGRTMVQPHLQSIMDPDSALGHYFHHPCHVCAGYRAVIRSFQKSANIDHSPEAADFRRNIAMEHAVHMQEAHASTWNSPPIEAIRLRLDLIRRRTDR